MKLGQQNCIVRSINGSECCIIWLYCILVSNNYSVSQNEGLGALSTVEFVNDFEQSVKQLLSSNFEGMIVFGSASDGRWKKGSDIDMVVYINRSTTLRERKAIYDAYWQLNEKYKLGLENVPVMHPIIFIADNKVKRILMHKLINHEIGFLPNTQQRKILKKICPPERLVKPFAHII